MTLSNEQCVEVVEKLWGWELRDWDVDPNRQRWMSQAENGRWHPESSGQFFIVEPSSQSTCSLQAVVKSWSGFGRTWDFFRDKYSHCVTIDFSWHEDVQGWACNIGIDTDYCFSGYGGTQFDAIHDAGLKAAGDLLDGQQHHQSPEAR